MADPVGILKQIAEVALRIKEAVETVRQNEKACLLIKGRVEIVSGTLSLCENDAELMEESAARAALEALGEVLGEALTLVTACQERSFMCLCWTAGNLSKQLSRVDQDISNKQSDATFAILVYFISKQNKDGAHPPPPSIERPPASAPEPEWSALSLDSEPEPPKKEDMVIFGQWSAFSLADQAEERNLLPEIGQVALEIKEAVQTVRQNKEECIEIGKRVNRVNELVSRFENTETMKDPEMSAQLEKLLETFRHAHTLVTACQRRNITIISPAGRLSKQLREVLDQTELTLDEMIAISVRCAGMV